MRRLAESRVGPSGILCLMNRATIGLALEKLIIVVGLVERKRKSRRSDDEPKSVIQLYDFIKDFHWRMDGMVEDSRTEMTKKTDKSGTRDKVDTDEKMEYIEKVNVESGTRDKVDTDEKMEYIEKVNVAVRVIDAGRKIVVG
ncbi:hypothetical protein Fot_22035 [Forsythia ovata]|uniref:Uncharacterized protein n=1 Tax=Forsythia ovata TaxID=205694 RepID=A0ABD1UWK0_9LAMI